VCGACTVFKPTTTEHHGKVPTRVCCSCVATRDSQGCISPPKTPCEDIDVLSQFDLPEESTNTFCKASSGLSYDETASTWVQSPLMLDEDFHDMCLAECPTNSAREKIYQEFLATYQHTTKDVTPFQAQQLLVGLLHQNDVIQQQLSNLRSLQLDDHTKTM